MGGPHVVLPLDWERDRISPWHSGLAVRRCAYCDARIVAGDGRYDLFPADDHTAYGKRPVICGVCGWARRQASDGS